MTAISATVTTAICALFFQQAAHPAPDTVSRAAVQAVLATYQKMEDADRRGDGALWLALRDRATLAAMDDKVKDAIRKGGRSRPNVRYEALATQAIGARSVILGKVTDPDANTVQYAAILFVLQEGEWKVAQEQLGEKQFDPFVLYAMLEPAEGLFSRDGSPWKSIPYAASNADVVRGDDIVWKVQATQDESFLYLRFEATQPLPAPGAKLRPEVAKTGRTGGPAAPPPMRIKTAGPNQYAISVNSLVSAAPSFDSKGRPSGDKFTVAYTLSVKNGDDEVFSTTISENSHNFLVTVHERFIDVRIPVAGLGDPAPKPAIDLEEADPVIRILPLHVQPYSGQ
jgi:hypothetical protein